MSSNQNDPPIPSVPDSVAGVPSPTKFQWYKSVELGYVEEPASTDAASAPSTSAAALIGESNEGPVCFHCGKTAKEAGAEKLSRCSKCQVAGYCSRDCQVANWKGGDGKVGHKFTCAAYKRVGEDMMVIFGDDKEECRQDILTKVRFYAFPYAVHRSSIDGRGFLFVQSDSSLAVLSLPAPVLSNGRKCPKQRSLLLHWLTMEEFDKEVVMDDFELASVRNELKSAVDSYDENKELPVLMRFRCGHVAVGTAPLVPDFKLCKVLGKEYYGSGEGSGALQLNIDDM